MDSMRRFCDVMGITETRSFFLIVPPGLEQVAERELQHWLAEAGFHQIQWNREFAGLSVELPLGIGLQLNRVLKIPSRILLRCLSFRCRDFTKLYKTIKKTPWNQWIGSHDVEWSVSSRKSRLKIKSRIEKTCREGWMAFRQGTPAKANPPKTKFQIYVRFEDDRCDISFDTSGDHLHFRGDKPLSSEAPLRENLAAALLWQMAEGEWSNLHEVTLVDAMAGSGTFSLEALKLFQVNQSREYAFQNMTVPELKNPWSSRDSGWKKVVTADRSEENCRIIAENFSSAGLAERLDLSRTDFFEPLPPEKKGEGRWLILNPPYGKRISLGQSQEQALVKIIEHSWAQGFTKIGCLYPQGKMTRRKALERWGEVESLLELQNGGLEVCFFCLKRPNRKMKSPRILTQ